MRTTDESRDVGRKFRDSGPTGGVACKFSCNWLTFLRGGGKKESIILASSGR